MNAFPGAHNAYGKFEKYLPREGVASFCAGPRIANFDRVEWLTTPDPSTQAAALRNAEVDWVEQPVMDLVPSLKTDRGLKVEVVETAGLIGVLRFNHLHPPFDNPAIRRAALRAVNQREFVTDGRARRDLRSSTTASASSRPARTMLPNRNGKT